MPTIGRLDHGREVVARRPSQSLARKTIVGDELGGIALAAGTLDGAEVSAADAPNRLDELADAGAGSRAEIDRKALPAGDQMFDGKAVGGGEIDDMDIITDRRAVRGVVVGAVDREAVAPPKGGCDRERDGIRDRRPPH